MTKKIILLIIIILVLIGIGSLISKKDSSHVKIGVISVRSGDKATLGKNFERGIEMARDEYVAAHPGTTVELVVEDDGYDGAKGIEAFKKLQSQNIDALIVATSPTINAIYPLLASTTIPVVTYGTQTEDKKDNVFHIFADPIFADMALGFALQSLVASTTQDVVGVYTNDPTLVNFYNAFKQSVGANINEYGLDLNNPASTKTAAQKVMAQKPKFVFMTNYANLGSQFIKELKALPGTKPTLVFDLTLNQALGEYEKTLGDLKILDGSLVVVPEKVDYTAFDERYKKKYPNDPQGELTDYGYDSLTLLLETKAKNGSDWIKNIEGVKTRGVTGAISFDPIGRRIPAFSVATIANGKIPEGK